MFVKLPTNTKIYAVSAANPTESSWGTYCSPDDVIQGKHIGSCLGDLFSVNFIEEVESIKDLTREDLQTQFEKIRTATTLSHVMQWGELSYVSDTLDNFFTGGKKSINNNFLNLRNPLPTSFYKPKESNIDSRYMKVKILTEIFKREKTVEAERELRE